MIYLLTNGSNYWTLPLASENCVGANNIALLVLQLQAHPHICFPIIHEVKPFAHWCTFELFRFTAWLWNQ